MHPSLIALLLLGACESGAFIDEVDDTALYDTGSDPVDEPEPLDPQDLPILLVHGINGSAANYDVMIDRLVDAGWAPEVIYAHTFDDPSWGCNVDNAATLSEWVDQILEETGQPRINLVAHSMGVLSTRYYLKHLGGTEEVSTYATLGGMHYGLSSACSPDFPFKPCVWDEICTSGEYVADLNEPPATPGPLNWVSIYGTGDDVVPNWSSQLAGAEWVAMEGVEHDGPDGLLQDEATFEEVERVLRYEVVAE